MDNSYIFNIDKNVFNIFSSNSINELIKKYNIDNYYYLNQIHSDIVYHVDENYINNSDGDALITNKVNIPLVIKTADCVAILIYDKKNKVIATVHSGWKGTLKSIAVKTVKEMIDKYNSKSEDINVYLYPSIRKCHYEVGFDVYEKFKVNTANIDKYVIKKNNKYYLSLQDIIIADLHKIGIFNIMDSNICTYCNHNKYYSYRYNHTDKRNYLLVMLKEQL